MKAVLLASVITRALTSEAPVPAGKAEIVTTESHAAYDCGGDKVYSRFQLDQDKCYGLSAVPTSVVNVDQKVHCLDNGDFVITTYKSSDGSCTGTSAYPTNKYSKGNCIVNVASGLSGAVTVRCPEPATKLNIVELAESVTTLSTLVSAVVAADLVDTLSSPGPFTVFAPTNNAFNALPSGTLDDLMKPANKGQLIDILTYHVLEGTFLVKDLDLFQPVNTVEGKPLHIQKWGGSVQVGPSLTDLKHVTGADNIASNGAVHIIDGVLLPPSSLTSTHEKNIVELAESVTSLSTLVSAVVAADLVETLSSAGPFTVFAPTNDAFNALPSGTLDDLMKPENKGQLADILTYHVLPGQFLVKDLDLFQPVKTLEGKPLHIQKWGGSVQVGPSLTDLKHVTGADNIASNGAVHIIDGVLLPPSSIVV